MGVNFAIHLNNLIVKKPQYLTIIFAFLGLCLLWAFGSTKPRKHQSAHTHEGHQHEVSDLNAELLSTSFSIDSNLLASQQRLSEGYQKRVEELNRILQSVTDSQEKTHVYHQLSQFWKDTGRAFIPFAWYTAEGARLENSEKNLNFAGHLFLNNLQEAGDNELRKWMALQAKDLFERTLQVNPDNDSAKVGLGATYIFGGISNAPMQGIAKIREVVDKDSSNVYAQMTLAMGSLMSGQTEKARERLETVARIDAENLQAVLLLADIYEKQGNKEKAIAWYQKALPLADQYPEMKAELGKRIQDLK